MARQIPIGARGTAEETVEFKHTLTAHRPELPEVYSTPDMIRLMEIAAFAALQPYCEGDEITVGTGINVQHRAASRVGQEFGQRRFWRQSTGVSTSCASAHGTTHRKLAAEPSAAPW